MDGKIYPKPENIKKKTFTCIFGGGCVLAVLFLTYWLWTPGQVITDGRHDRRSNGIWMQHGWLGDDGWFVRHRRQSRLAYFRNPDEVRKMAELLQLHGVTDVFPHLCPASPDGSVPPVDALQTQSFLAKFQNFRVMPWIGGVSGFEGSLTTYCHPPAPAFSPVSEQ